MEKRNYYIENYGTEDEDLNKVDKKLKENIISGYIVGRDNEKIYYEQYKAQMEKGSILISHGFSECIEKYKEIIYYFIMEGYSVYIIEHRGHGRSGSLGVIDKTQIHIEDFNDYIEDLKIFIDRVIGKINNLYLFAHSMGGTIAGLFLKKYPNYFDKVILNSPMFEIKVENIPSSLAKLISKLSVEFGRGFDFAFGNFPFEANYDFFLAETSSEARYRRWYKEISCNSEVQRGGASFKWLYEALENIDLLLNNEDNNKIKTPILLLQAGKDSLVGSKGHIKFKEICENCNIIRYEKGKHDLYLETDEILFDYMNKIFDFLDE